MKNCKYKKKRTCKGCFYNHINLVTNKCGRAKQFSKSRYRFKLIEPNGMVFVMHDKKNKNFVFTTETAAKKFYNSIKTEEDLLKLL